MAPQAAIQVEGLAEFRKALAKADKDAAAQFTRAQRFIKDLVVNDAKSKGRTSPRGPLRHFSKGAGIGGTSNKDGATIRVKNPAAMAAFMGHGGRTGWYAAGRYSASRGRQFAPHVGNSWQVGGPGGPYALNPAIRDNLDEIDRRYLTAFEVAASRAFPDGGTQF